MRSRRLRWIVSFAVMALVGVLHNLACVSFAGEQFLRTVDFCFLFDCQNGALGGLVDPCPDTPDADGNSINLFVDCPETTN